MRESDYTKVFHIPSLKLRLAWEGVLVGLFAGVWITLLRLCLGFVASRRSHMVAFLQQLPPSYVLLWAAALVVLGFVIAALVHWSPIAGGSGIPQVRGIVLGLEESPHWLRVIIVKLLGTSLGIGAGLSMGREGPSVQIGAMAGQGVSRALSKTNLEERALISSGAGAGLAAAFNAPLAGVMFTMEAIHKNLSALVMVPTLMASITATVLVHGVFGRDTVFAIPKMSLLPVEYLPQLIGLGLFTGLVGVLFNKGSLNMGRFYNLPIFKSLGMKIAVPLLLTIPLTYLLPEVLGAGDPVIEAMVDLKGTISFVLLLLVVKIIFTLFSTGSGTPGGSLQPMLVFGALCGSLYGNLAVALGILPPEYRLHMVVFAMAGLFTGCVRAPVTGMLLLLELTGRFYHLVPLGIVVMFAYAAGELCHDTPIFDAMLLKSLQKDARAKEAMDVPKNQELLEIPIEEGSFAEGKTLAEIQFPGRALVVSIRRGDVELIHDKDARLLSGDYIYVMPNKAKIIDLTNMCKCKNE